MTVPETQIAGATSVPTQGPAAVAGRSLEKSFGPVTVLRRIDLRVERGEIVALFGPNGAGKSTLMRVLATLTRPDAGGVLINGHDTQKAGEAARLTLGAVLHSPMLYADMTARENLKFFARMFRLRNVDERIAVLAGKVGIEARLDQRVRELSHGYQKRVALARAMLHQPSLLLLDEAESGLDAQAQAVLEETLAEHGERGGSAIVITHSVGRGLAMSDRALAIVRGRFVLDRPSCDVTPDEVAGLYRTHGEAV